MLEAPTTCPVPARLEPAHDDLKEAILRHITVSCGSDNQRLTPRRVYQGLSYAVRDRLAEAWVASRRKCRVQKAKRVYYLSLEFLPGRFLRQNIINAGMSEEVDRVLAELGFELSDLEEREAEPGLGNGGLGRLASCYLESMATLGLPGQGYGILYTYGLFNQSIQNGFQVEKADTWLRFGSTWVYLRPHFFYGTRFYGRVETVLDEAGQLRRRWVDTDLVKAVACDILVPGHGGAHAVSLRLWAARSSTGFNLSFFNTGHYLEALAEKSRSEEISMVLYPEDDGPAGKELRFKQQYFLVSATLQDILRRHENQRGDLAGLPESVAIQLNETHPAIAVAELMRVLVDERAMDWEEAFDICVGVFAYTNHTVLPEALESWPVDLVARVLPRHMEIIFEINRRFLDQVQARWPGDLGRMERLSLIAEGPVKYVRMAHLAIVGSHKTNGVAELHSRILKDSVFRDFYELYPERFDNVTNGVTPRRFLLQANPGLAGLVTEAIGPAWVTDLDRLRDLAPLAMDPEFRRKWRAIRLANKEDLAARVKESTDVEIFPEGLFDVQAKRIHEYKRQVLNILHVVTLYGRIKDLGEHPTVGRSVLFGGKAAPGYAMAKRIIKLITAVAEVINADPEVNSSLRVVFLPNFNVAQSERLIRAADLSEQISTAGMEASGTGNMKFALNGALTIGTLDGANIEIREEVGPENFFTFGLTAEEVRQRRAEGHNPRMVYEFNPDLKRALDLIASGFFSPRDPGLFAPIVAGLLDHGDWFMVTADYEDYLRRQEEAARTFLDVEDWTRRSILNVAAMGRFSSDRAVMEYARRVWGVSPLA